MANKILLIATVAALSTLNAFTASGQTANDVVVRDAWVREATPQDRATGVFLVIENRSTTALSLVGADGAGAATGELHTMKMANEMMRMERVQEIPIPARGTAELKPGGFHIMLFKLSKPLVAGGSTTLTLHFSNGVTKSVPVAVVKRSATGIK
ncbi:MAG: copper chaperone PCu(A)C [Vicinamibacterales bacterium]